MPALPSSLIEPLWDQFAALIPHHVDTHPLGCHRPRIADRIVFDKLLQVLVLGAGYARISDSTCSATTIRTRRDEWIDAGIFEQLEQLCLEAYDQIVGLDLGDVTVDGCIVKAPCGGQAAGKSPWTEANSAPNALCWWTAAGSHWDAWSRRRTGTTPRCYARPWRSSPDSTKDSGWACPTGSRSTWTPGTTAPRPATCSRSWAATA